VEINHLFKLYHAPAVNSADYLSVYAAPAALRALRVVASGATTSTARASAFLGASSAGYL